ncbi:MAG: hypothetical protein ABW007_13915 [Chitinophagaceae bacterium]
MSTFAKRPQSAMLLLFSTLFIMASSCNNDQQESPSLAAPASEKTDASTNHLQRDPSDTSQHHDAAEPVSQSANEKTVDLIRRMLTTSIFKDDLAAMKKQDRQFTFIEMDLNGDRKKEIFVGFNGSYYCGSGGCTALLLHHNGTLITRFTVTKYPIVVRPISTNGWRDLLIGTAAPSPSMHLVKWNGKKYPGNPSMQPAFSIPPSERSVRIFNFATYEEQWFSF